MFQLESFHKMRAGAERGLTECGAPQYASLARVIEAGDAALLTGGFFCTDLAHASIQIIGTLLFEATFLFMTTCATNLRDVAAAACSCDELLELLFTQRW
jgi:hypothetical protein